jgi:hypothetical protein
MGNDCYSSVSTRRAAHEGSACLVLWNSLPIRIAACLRYCEVRLGAIVFLVTLDPKSELKLTPYLAKLPRGPYSWTFQRVGAEVWTDLRSFDWDPSREGATFPVLGPGLYDIRIIDPLHYSREHLYVLALSTDSSGGIASSFLNAKRCLYSWDGIAGGWPVHELLRLYLEKVARDSAMLP